MPTNKYFYHYRPISYLICIKNTIFKILKCVRELFTSMNYPEGVEVNSKSCIFRSKFIFFSLKKTKLDLNMKLLLFAECDPNLLPPELRVNSILIKTASRNTAQLHPVNSFHKSYQISNTLLINK